MALVKFNPTFPTLFDRFLEDDFFPVSKGMDNGNLPAVNIKETESDFRVEVAVPGLKKDEFNIEVDENVLTISSERENKTEEKDNDGNYTRREFSYSSFKRSFTLPDNVKEDSISAEYQNGILNVIIPKAADVVKEKKFIKIS